MGADSPLSFSFSRRSGVRFLFRGASSGAAIVECRRSCMSRIGL